MAQNVAVIRKYKGSFEATGGVLYSGSLFPADTIMQMKSKNIRVSVNGGAMFEVTFDDESLIDPTYTYKFDKDCVIALQDEIQI